MLGIWVSLLIAAAPAVQQETIEPTVSGLGSPDAPGLASGLKLAELMYSEEQQVRVAVRQVDVSVLPMFRANPDYQALEVQYPGIIEATGAKMRDLIAEYTRQGLPKYRRRVANLYASHLSSAELDDLYGFYASPTGRKLISALYENYEMDAVMGEVAKDPDAQTSLTALRKDHNAATAHAAKAIDASDTAALVALGQKPYIAKMRALAPMVRKLDQQFINEPDPEFEAQVEKAIDRVLTEFIARADRNANKK